MPRTLLAAGAALLLLAGFTVLAATSADKYVTSPAALPGVSPAADLYALSETVARRSRDLDQADLRIQEERRLLEKIREEVRQQIVVLDGKLSAMEKITGEQDQVRKAARLYVSKVFRAMAAEDAARRLQLMGEKESARILKEMKEKDAAKILSKMEPQFSATVTQWMEK